MCPIEIGVAMKKKLALDLNLYWKSGLWHDIRRGDKTQYSHIEERVTDRQKIDARFYGKSQ